MDSSESFEARPSDDACKLLHRALKFHFKKAGEERSRRFWLDVPYNYTDDDAESDELLQATMDRCVASSDTQAMGTEEKQISARLP
jgi:hypothetical protein